METTCHSMATIHLDSKAYVTWGNIFCIDALKMYCVASHVRNVYACARKSMGFEACRLSLGMLSMERNSWKHLALSSVFTLKMHDHWNILFIHSIVRFFNLFFNTKCKIRTRYENMSISIIINFGFHVHRLYIVYLYNCIPFWDSVWWNIWKFKYRGHTKQNQVAWLIINSVIDWGLFWSSSIPLC